MSTSYPTFHYDSDLIGGSLMVRESRIMAELLLAVVEGAACKAAIMDDNRLQKARPASAKRMAQAIRKRLERLPPPFWQALRDGDDQLATQVAFCAALARNLLLVEFLETVAADAIVIQSETLGPISGTTSLPTAPTAIRPLPAGPPPRGERWGR